MRLLSRRAALAIGASGAALSIIGFSRSAVAAAKEAAEQIAKFTAGKTAEQGKVTIELPEIAENGNTVPLSVAVDSPMTADNYVSEIMVVSEGNPNPGVATFHLSLIHISEPTRRTPISYAVFCLKKKKNDN